LVCDEAVIYDSVNSDMIILTINYEFLSASSMTTYQFWNADANVKQPLIRNSEDVLFVDRDFHHFSEGW
jgi:hypothetical protein